MEGEPHDVRWRDGEERAREAAREPGTHLAVVGKDGASLFVPDSLPVGR